MAETILAVIITLNTIFSLLPGMMPTSKCYEAESPDDVLLNAVIAADLHTDAQASRDRTNILRKAFVGISKDKTDLDAVIFAGDNTNCGDEAEYANLRRLTSVYLKTDRIIPAMGNHDSWHHSDDPDYEKAEELFQDYCAHCGIDTDKNYYSTAVNGFYFIVLGTETIMHNGSRISDVQAEWFDKTLGEACESGKPIFIICHQTLAGHNGIRSDDDDAGSIGKDSAKIEAILNKHAADSDNPIFFFSGHLHVLNDSTHEKNGNIHYVTLPSLEYTYGGGLGFVLEVYSDKVLLRCRNFITDCYVDHYEYSIPCNISAK